MHILHYFRTCVYIDCSKLWRSRICDIQCVVCHISAVIWYLLFQISGQLFGSLPTQLSPRPKVPHNKEVKPTQMLYLFTIFWDKFGHPCIGYFKRCLKYLVSSVQYIKKQLEIALCGIQNFNSLAAVWIDLQFKLSITWLLHL